MKLSNSAIAQIAKTLQLAILTGTDVVDNLRTMRFTPDGDELYPDENYMNNFEDNLNSLLENASDPIELNSSPESIFAREN